MLAKEYRPAILGQDEQARLDALADLQAWGGQQEETFDRIARLTKAALGFPLGYVSLVELDRQIIKSHTDGAFCDGNRNTAFCSSTIEANRPLIIVDALKHNLFSTFPQVVGPPYVRSYWGVPLTTRAGFNVGALCVLDHVPRSPDSKQIELLQEFGQLAIECMELQAQASTDVLTGLRTRRAFLAEAERMLAKSVEKDRPLSCIAIDVDRFKSVNDTLGHAVGDQLLRNLGSLLHHELQPDQLAGRIGGEEFAIFVREPLMRAVAIAERLRVLLADQLSKVVPGCTASFGIAARIQSDNSLGSLMQRADQEVYAAKRAGRNCTRPQFRVSPPLAPEILGKSLEAIRSPSELL